MKFCSIDIVRFKRINKLLKLILTDLDGTFLNSQGAYNRDYFLKLWPKLKENQIAFGVCTGKSSARVETLFPEISDEIWILGDSATRIKYQGKCLYEQLLDNQITLAMNTHVPYQLLRDQIYTHPTMAEALNDVLK